MDADEAAAGVDADGKGPLEEEGGVQESETKARPAETRDAIERMHGGLVRKGRNIRESRTHAREDQPVTRPVFVNSHPTHTPNTKFEDAASTRWTMRTSYGMYGFGRSSPAPITIDN